MGPSHDTERIARALERLGVADEYRRAHGDAAVLPSMTCVRCGVVLEAVLMAGWRHLGVRKSPDGRGLRDLVRVTGKRLAEVDHSVPTRLRDYLEELRSTRERALSAGASAGGFGPSDAQRCLHLTDSILAWYLPRFGLPLGEENEEVPARRGRRSRPVWTALTGLGAVALVGVLLVGQQLAPSGVSPTALTASLAVAPCDDPGNPDQLRCATLLDAVRCDTLARGAPVRCAVAGTRLPEEGVWAVEGVEQLSIARVDSRSALFTGVLGCSAAARPLRVEVAHPEAVGAGCGELGVACVESESAVRRGPVRMERVTPGRVRRGQTVQLTVHGCNLCNDAGETVFWAGGIEIESARCAEDGTRAEVRGRVIDRADLGWAPCAIARAANRFTCSDDDKDCLAECVEVR